jgi:Co/Zn/Cd efflux system component
VRCGAVPVLCCAARSQRVMSCRLHSALQRRDGTFRFVVMMILTGGFFFVEVRAAGVLALHGPWRAPTSLPHRACALLQLWMSAIAHWQLIVGVSIGSLSLQADAFHMASDVMSLVVGYIASKLSGRKASVTVTYGYSRTEVLGGLANAIFLLAVCFNITIESLHRFR